MIGFAGRMVFRSLTRRARRSAVTFTGVALAVASLVVLAAVMEGVSEAMIRNSVAIQVGHVHVTWPEDSPPAIDARRSLVDVRDLRTALWRKHREALVGVGGRQSSAIIYAVEPRSEQKESVVPLKIIRGRYLASPGSIVVGSSLGKALHADVGDTVELRTAGSDPLSFRIEGVFHTGTEILDRLAYVGLEDLPGPADELVVYLHSPSSAESAARVLDRLFPEAVVATWTEALPELVQLISLNRVAMNVVFGLALLILAFGISNAAFLSVSERTRELGILQAMGMRPWRIVLMILAEMALLVCAAGASGVALGSVGAEIMRHVGLDLGAWTSANRHFLVSGVIYPRLTMYAVVTPGVVAVVCVLLAGAGPAWRGATTDVVRALRWI